MLGYTVRDISYREIFLSRTRSRPPVETTFVPIESSKVFDRESQATQSTRNPVTCSLDRAHRSAAKRVARRRTFSNNSHYRRMPYRTYFFMYFLSLLPPPTPAITEALVGVHASRDRNLRAGVLRARVRSHSGLASGKLCVADVALSLSLSAFPFFLSYQLRSADA